MKFFRTSLVAVAASLAISVSFGVNAANIAAGKAKATTVCAACHGANGKASESSHPNLAGQNYQYLVNALHAYKAKQRTGGLAVIMQGMAATLSDADINNVAAYFSSLKPQ